MAFTDREGEFRLVMRRVYAELLEWAEANPYPDFDALFVSPLAEPLTRAELERLTLPERWDEFMAALREEAARHA